MNLSNVMRIKNEHSTNHAKDKTKSYFCKAKRTCGNSSLDNRGDCPIQSYVGIDKMKKTTKEIYKTFRKVIIRFVIMSYILGVIVGFILGRYL